MTFCFYSLQPHAKKKITQEMSLITTFVHFNSDIKKKSKRAANSVFTVVNVYSGLREIHVPSSHQCCLSAPFQGTDTSQTREARNKDRYFLLFRSEKPEPWHNPTMLSDISGNISVLSASSRQNWNNLPEHCESVVQRPTLLTTWSW